MTISEYVRKLTEKDKCFMRFLKETRLQRIFFKSITQYPLKSEVKHKGSINCRANFILNAFVFHDAEELLNKYYPTLTWSYLDDMWYTKGSRCRKIKNILETTKLIKKAIT